MIELTTVDAHSGGAPVRLITGGAPSPRGRGMREKTAWMARHGDHVRTALMREPRGHRDMTGVMLTEPVAPGSHAGLIFMHADGYAPMAGHAVIATTVLALSRGLLMPGGEGQSVVYDTIAGTVRAFADDPASSAGSASTTIVEESARVTRITVETMPSFVLAGGVVVSAAGRMVRADVAYGGVFYAIVDAESLGLAVTVDHLPMLRKISRDVCDAFADTHVVAHPLDGKQRGVAGTLFTGPAASGADLRAVAVLATGTAGRSGSGTGTAAVMAVLDAMGLLGDESTVVMEGLSGATLSGRVAARTVIGEIAAIVPAITGTAWMTGEHRFVVDPLDPFARGME